MRFRVLILVSLLSCSVALSQRNLAQKDLIALRERMTGFFTSESQSLKDSANYFNIHLHMVQIWQGKPGGYWLYVEQATVSSLDKPYRQRIYRLSLFNDSTISSQVYEINDPLRFAGAWKNSMMLKNLSEDSLIAREGCAILLHRNENGDFTGSTPGKDCKSSLRGAAYATSEAIIYSNKLVTWDRGWSADDKQVWGATLGGYEFIRQSSYQ